MQNVQLGLQTKQVFQKSSKCFYPSPHKRTMAAWRVPLSDRGGVGGEPGRSSPWAALKFVPAVTPKPSHSDSWHGRSLVDIPKEACPVQWGALWWAANPRSAPLWCGQTSPGPEWHLRCLHEAFFLPFFPVSPTQGWTSYVVSRLFLPLPTPLLSSTHSRFSWSLLGTFNPIWEDGPDQYNHCH